MRKPGPGEMSCRAELLAEQKLLTNGLLADTWQVIGTLATQSHEVLRASPQRMDYPHYYYDLHRRRITTLTTTYAPTFPGKSIPLPGNDKGILYDVQAVTAQTVLAQGRRIPLSRRFRTVSVQLGRTIEKGGVAPGVKLEIGENGFVYGDFGRDCIPQRKIANPRSHDYMAGGAYYYRDGGDLRSEYASAALMSLAIAGTVAMCIDAAYGIPTETTGISKLMSQWHETLESANSQVKLYALGALPENWVRQVMGPM
jgi:hypothetical protein